MLSAALVWLALQTFGDELPTGSVSGADTNYARIVVEGTQLNRLMPQNEVLATLSKAESGIVLNLRPIDAFFPLNADAGPHFRLAPDLEVAFSAQPIRVTLRARSASQNGAPALEAIYLAGPEGNSGWQRFMLTSDFQDYTFTYVTPKASVERGVDFLGIRPVVEGQNGAIELEQVIFENLSLTATPLPETKAATP